MQVIFRKDRTTKEIVAFLPECPVNYGNIMSYMHIGQPDEASLSYYHTTEKPTTEEFLPLLGELQKIYDDEDLQVKHKLNYDLLKKSWR